MKQISIIILLIFFVFAAGCNLPSKTDTADTSAMQTATSDAMIYLVQTAQAEIETASEPEDEPELIVRNPEDAGTVPELPPEPAEEPTPEPLPTAAPNRVPPELPEIYQSADLNKLDTPHTYVQDTCELIKNRWSEGKAAPGTIVMAIMYHGIMQGEDTSSITDPITRANTVTVEQHKQLMRTLHDQGFTAINTEQFIAFMESNEWIPERSVLIIQDDRHYEENFTEHFKPYYDEWGWPVINGWISADNTTPALWEENARVEAEGYVDHQAHGVVHNQNMGNDSSDEFLIGELKGSVDAIEEHFHKTPRAIIWPGGGFGSRPIEIAKEYGYKVGFTTSARGPVMYNWVPLCDEYDPARPAYLVDGSQDPLFVIPRFWDTDAVYKIDTVRQMGKEARDYLYSIRETEVEYYDIVCKPVMGEL